MATENEETVENIDNVKTEDEETVETEETTEDEETVETEETVDSIQSVIVGGKARSIYDTTISSTPTNATGDEHDFEILEAVSGGSTISSPNDYLVKDSTIYYDSTASASSASVITVLTGNSTYKKYDMMWLSSTDYMTIKTTKACRLHTIAIRGTYFKLSTSSSTGTLVYFNAGLKVEKLINGEYVDFTGITGKTLESITTNTWQTYIDVLPAGTWKFSYKSGRRIDGYWYLEELEEQPDTSISEVKINKIKEDELKDTEDIYGFNSINFVDDGSLHIYSNSGERVQVGCSRKEFEELKERLTDKEIKFTKNNW